MRLKKLGHSTLVDDSKAGIKSPSKEEIKKQKIEAESKVIE